VKTGMLVLLLAALCALGGWNYWRNLQREQAEQSARPFAGYHDADLQALAAAYRSEVETLRKRYEATRKARPEARRQALVGDGIREFERVQRHSAREREATAELAQQEARLHDVEKELAYRAEMGSGWTLQLRRLTRI
jgi:ketosteroid isomerase-like protein